MHTRNRHGLASGSAAGTASARLRALVAALLAALVAVFGLAVPAHAAPTTIFEDDFSSGSLSGKWNTTTDWQVLTNNLGNPGQFAYGPNAWLGGNVLQRDGLSTLG